jgi:hypothetical protein
MVVMLAVFFVIAICSAVDLLPFDCFLPGAGENHSIITDPLYLIQMRFPIRIAFKHIKFTGAQT